MTEMFYDDISNVFYHALKSEILYICFYLFSPNPKALSSNLPYPLNGLVLQLRNSSSLSRICARKGLPCNTKGLECVSQR